MLHHRADPFSGQARGRHLLAIRTQNVESLVDLEHRALQELLVNALGVIQRLAEGGIGNGVEKQGRRFAEQVKVEQGHAPTGTVDRCEARLTLSVVVPTPPPAPTAATSLPRRALGRCDARPETSLRACSKYS